MYVPASEHTADVLTKGPFRPMFEKIVDKLGCIPETFQREGSVDKIVRT